MSQVGLCESLFHETENCFLLHGCINCREAKKLNINGKQRYDPTARDPRNHRAKVTNSLGRD